MRRSGSKGWQGNYNKILEGRILNVMFLRKFKKPMSCFQIKVFFIVFFLYFFCVHYFLFALLIFIRTTKWQKAHINIASNIYKVIHHNYKTMAKIKRWVILNFQKNYLISSYLGVTLSSRNIKDNFCFT